MKRILTILAAVLLSSCKGVPVSLAYTGQLGGHDVTAGYSTANGASLTGHKITGQK